MAKDYYKTLGINKNASKEEIKKAFHKLAHQHHPDRGGNETKFKEINEAYQVLSDEGKRAQYDRFGSAYGPTSSRNWRDYAGQGFAGQAWDFGNMGGFEGFPGQGEGVEFDLGDIFSDFFGGRSRRRASRRGEDITVDLEISLTDALLGAEKVVRINKFVACSTCKASGAEPGSEMERCPMCEGKGSIREARASIFGRINVESLCHECDGVGKRPKVKCRACKGAGILRTTDEIHADIPSGIASGEVIKVAGRGEAIRGGPAGDLYIRLRVHIPTRFSKRAREALEELRKEGI